MLHSLRVTLTNLLMLYKLSLLLLLSDRMYTMVRTFSRAGHVKEGYVTIIANNVSPSRQFVFMCLAGTTMTGVWHTLAGVVLDINIV